MAPFLILMFTTSPKFAFRLSAEARVLMERFDEFNGIAGEECISTSGGKKVDKTGPKYTNKSADDSAAVGHQGEKTHESFREIFKRKG